VEPQECRAEERPMNLATMSEEEINENQLVNPLDQLAWTGIEITIPTVDTAHAPTENGLTKEDGTDNTTGKPSKPKVEFAEDVPATNTVPLRDRKPLQIFRRISSLRFIDLKEKQKFKCITIFLVSVILLLSIVMAIMGGFMYHYYNQAKIIKEMTFMYQETNTCVDEQVMILF